MFRNIAGELMRDTLTQMRAAAVLLLCFSAIASSAATRQQAHPDVILVTIDTLRADHVGCYGYKDISTPAMDDLARQGVRFANAFTASPITNSSHATILTGLYPSSHGVSDFGVPLATPHTTIAELMKARGYETAAFIGAVVLDSKQLAPGFDRGFDHYDNFPVSSSGPRFGRLERRAMTVVERAETWMSGHQSGPRFVWVHLYDPHDPYEPPGPYSQQYKSRLYDGEIAYADHALGTLMAYLRAHRRYDNALIIVVGDHGEGLGQHGENTHGIFLYDTTTHVPLIMKLPGGSHPGEVVASQVRTVDIVPTILSYSGPDGARVTANFDGSSLRPTIELGERQERTAIAETDYPLRFGWAPLRSVRTREFKFIEAPRPELYDLLSDSAEKQNKYEPWNQFVQESRKKLAQLKEAAQPQRSGGAVPQTTVDELRALGYLGPEGATDVPEPSLLPDPKDKIQVQNFLHTAMMAAEDGRKEVARGALTKAVEVDPNSAIALGQLGELELKLNDYPAAKSHLLRARQLNGRDVTVLLNLGRAMQKTGDLAGAREAVQAALSLSPGQSAAREMLGDILMQMHEPRQAAEQYEAVVFLTPANTSTRLAFARALLDSGEFERAAGQAREVTRADSRSRAAYLILQQCYEKMGKSALASQAAQQAAELARSEHQ